MTNLSGTNLNNGAAVGPQGEGRESPSRFPTYPAYKDSGVEWLGEVPEHWQIKALRYLSVCLDGKRIPLNGEQRADKQGDIPYWGANAVMDYVDEAIFDEELLLVGEDGAPFLDPLKPVAFHSSGPVWPNNHIHVLRPNRPEWVRFLVYAMNSADYANYIEGSTRQKLNQSRLMGMPVSWPSYEEQTQIARFLDHETARIDALIEEQQRLIELLKEKRQAVISHAVTKGLDPTVPMKDSGVEWLGEVPAHWVLKRIKHVTLSFDQGWSPQCENQPVEDDMQPGVLKTGCVNGGIFRSDENKRLPDDLELVSSLTVHAGDLLVSRANTRELVGSAAVPTVSYPNLMISDKIFRVRVMKKEANSRFLAFYLGSPFARREIELSATGASSSMLNISQSAIADMLFPCPPVLDQERIVRHIVEETYRLLALAEQALRLRMV
ncbi:restriction endonuclease subunit S [Pseudomonas sp. s199]|nr:restriction endonuclease subunit S [Pseudomonas sp. s199]